MASSVTKLFVQSPWYGLLEIVGEPGVDMFWGTACWNGKQVLVYVTSTLQPLTREAAAMLGVRWGTAVWTDEKKQQWEHTPMVKCNWGTTFAGGSWDL